MANAIANISLCSVPITPTNQIDFANATVQQTFFNNHLVVNFPKCHYQSRSDTLKVKGYVDSLQNCNYGFYTNTYNNVTKTFYFWIAKKEYKARETTELTIVIDTFQTWMFDYTFQPSFIEREHVIQDYIGAHTIPENFELGDYVSLKKDDITCLKGNPCFFIGLTDIATAPIGGIFGKTYSGFCIKYYNYADISQLSALITQLCNDGKADSIAFIFSFPDGLYHGTSSQSGLTIIGEEGLLHAEQNFNWSEQVHNFAFQGKAYTPYNSKLYTYPYNMIVVKNNSNNVVLKLENFEDVSNIKFAIDSVLTQNPVISCTPLNYKNKTFAIDDGIEMSEYGLCSWNNDNYANWFANNRHTINAQSANATNSYNAKNTVNSNNYTNALDRRNTSATKGAINTALSTMGALGHLNFLGALSNVAGGSANTYLDYGQNTRNAQNDLTNSDLLNTTNYQNTITSIMASVQDASVQPNTCKGSTSSCGLDMARDTATFYLEQVAIKPEYAKMIDMYFQMYGYKVNRVKIPNTKSRARWNYLKTVGANITGNIPQEDLDNLQQLFDNGLTIWHDFSYMCQYDIANSIVVTGED